MTFTSKQIDALQQYSEAVDAFVQAFGQDYPIISSEVEIEGVIVKTWADSNPVPESEP